MKKVISLALVLVMCLCACQNGNSAPDSDVNTESIDTTETATVQKMNVEDLTGTWSQSLWFFTTKMALNDNTTYDYGEEKGTFSVSEIDNIVKLSPRFGSNGYTDYKYLNGYLYATKASFAKDMEYGLPFTPDENGMSNQRFNINLSEDLRFDPAVEANSIDFTLKDDGTFTIFTSIFRFSSSLGYYFNDKPFNTYEGTYRYQDSILTLTYEGADYPLVVENGVIYYMTYSK